MTEPMTDARLTEIEALEAAATEGPWEITYDHDDRPDTDLSVTFPTAIGPFTWIEHPTAREDADSVFVAAARTAVPEMAAEIRRLRVENAALEQRFGDLQTEIQRQQGAWDRTVARWKADYADLRARLAAKEA